MEGGEETREKRLLCGILLGLISGVELRTEQPRVSVFHGIADPPLSNRQDSTSAAAAAKAKRVADWWGDRACQAGGR